MDERRAFHDKLYSIYHIRAPWSSWSYFSHLLTDPLPWAVCLSPVERSHGCTEVGSLVVGPTLVYIMNKDTAHTWAPGGIGVAWGQAEAS